MAWFKLERIILLAVVLMRLAAAEDAENPTIETCPSPSSVKSSGEVTKYTCSGDPGYTVGTDAEVAGPTTVDFTNGEFEVSFISATSLQLTTIPDCGAGLTGPVSCPTLGISIGSKAEGMDGSVIQVGGNGADGLVTWECMDSASPPVGTNYYFPISFTATQEMAAVSVGVLTTAFSSASTPATNFDPMDFAKFSAVDKDTEVYLLKDSEGTYHTLFISAETTIMFKADQYATITGSADNTALAKQAASTCDNAVRLCFEDGCDGAVTVSSLRIFVLGIAFLVAVLN